MEKDEKAEKQRSSKSTLILFRFWCQLCQLNNVIDNRQHSRLDRNTPVPKKVANQNNKKTALNNIDQKAEKERQRMKYKILTVVLTFS